MSTFNDQTQDLIDELVRRLEDEWRTHGEADLARFLPPADFRQQALVALIPVDQELRWGRGRQKTVEEYLAEWPELAASPSAVGVFREAEARLRAEVGTARPTSQPGTETVTYVPPLAPDGRGAGGEGGATPPPLPGAIHIRCPHCHNPVEIIVRAAPGEITCPTCGSTFTPAQGAGDEGRRERGEGRDAAGETLPSPSGRGAGGEGAPGGEGTATTSHLPLPTSHVPAPRRIAHFELLELLGEGAFGSVWKARDTRLGRTVAIKIPRRGQFDPHDAERFLREAKAAAGLQHPNIVTVHEAGQEGDLVYIVSELIEGQPLDKWIEAQGRRPTDRQSAELCATIAEALDYAHQHGVIHRDLKPSNIMIDCHGRPHIMDFGLAKRQAAEITMTVEGQILGTPAYMSPEQARGQGHLADARTDIYSLGVVLFELLTGERPFRGDVRMLLQQVVEEEAPPARKLNNRIPKDLETICAKCLEKPPQRRYATARDMADELRRFLRGEPIESYPISKPERLWRWCKRQPVVAGLTAAVALTLLVGSVVSSLFGIFAHRSEQRAVEGWAQADENAIRADQKASEAEDNAKQARAELLRTRTAQYAIQIGLAQRAISENDYVDAERALDDCALDLRGWEHRHLWTRICKRRTVLRGHTRWVTSVAISADGRWIVSGGGWDNTVRVWDVSSGHETLTLNGAGWELSVATSRDGRRIVSGGKDGTIKVWDAATGREAITLKADAFKVESVAISADGKRIVSAGWWDKTVKVWDVASGRETLTLTGHAEGVTSVAISADSRRIVSGGRDGTVKVWDAASGQQVVTLKGDRISVHSVAISPDGRRIVCGGFDGIVKVWDPVTAQNTLALRGHRSEVLTVAISADGQRIVSGGEDGTVKVWDAATGQETLSIVGHASKVYGVAISADGRRIVSGGHDNNLCVWDAGIGYEALTLAGHAVWGGVTSVAFSADSRWIVSGGGDSTVKVWDVATNQELVMLKGHSGTVSSVALSPDGKHIASGSEDGTVKVWNVATGREIRTLKGHTGTVSSVAISPDGRRIVSGGGDWTVKIWDAATGQETLTLKGHTGRVWSVAMSPDGRRIATGGGIPSIADAPRLPPGDDKTVRVWDVASGQETLTLVGHTGSVLSVAISPDGRRIVSGGDDKMVKVWDATTGQEALTLVGHTGSVLSVAISPDGRRIVSGGDDKMVKVWDATTGQETLTLKGHTDRVQSVAFSADGKRIASGSKDGIVRVWEATLPEDAGRTETPAGAGRAKARL